MYKSDNTMMPRLFLSLLLVCIFCLGAQAENSLLTSPQSQAISQFMPSEMPLVYAKGQAYQKGATTLGRDHKKALNYLKLQYFKSTRPTGSLLIIEHRSGKQPIQQCRRKFATKKIKHPQLGTLLTCVQQRGKSASAYIYPQQIPQEIEIIFTGPLSEIANAMKSLKLKRLPPHQKRNAPNYAAFYKQRIMQLKHPEYELRSSQLVWTKQKPEPRLVFGYHRAIPFIDKGVTQHMQVTLTHYPKTPPQPRCRAPKRTKSTTHPSFGAYRLCVENKLTKAYAGAKDQSPIHSVLFSATPAQNNRMGHVAIRLHSLPGEETKLLHSLN